MNAQRPAHVAIQPPIAAFAALVLILALLLLWMPGDATAQIDVHRDVECCNIDEAAAVVWIGTDSTMTFDQIAAHCAPILWFSPDEPLNRDVNPIDFTVPMNMPYEEPADGPVVYYRIRNVLRRIDTTPFSMDPDDPTNRDKAILDFNQSSAIDLDFFFYYPSEEGLGGHTHDVESVEMKIGVFRQPDCDDCRFGIAIMTVTGKAHGVLWYDNTLSTDKYTNFPMTILVEEGKHASCTDKNGDGQYTPGYDVNHRVNDAWGVRDVLRSGQLFTGGFQSWLAKLRKEPDRVFPPLPDDSTKKEWHTNEEGVYAAGYAIYELRPWPKLSEAEAWPDQHIMRFADKGYDDWPYEVDDEGIDEIGKFFNTETFAKSLSISARFDNDVGISFVFPLLIFKNVEEPMSGGWLVNRLIFKDKSFRDIAWNIMYTPSASRWYDGYFAAGVYWDSDGTDTRSSFMTETGIKFRGDVSHSPLKFMAKLTDFWGMRFGIQYLGYRSFSALGYVIEFGAGTF